MPTVIDFDSTPRAAFARGFLKGLAAPVVLFSNSTVSLPPVPQVKPVVSAGGDAGALSRDWVRIGGDMRVAITRNGTAKDQGRRQS
jgi:hypothetical protein